MKLRDALSEAPKKYLRDTQMYVDYLKAKNVVIKKEKFTWNGEEYDIVNQGHTWVADGDEDGACKSKIATVFWYIKNRS